MATMKLSPVPVSPPPIPSEDSHRKTSSNITRSVSTDIGSHAVTVEPGVDESSQRGREEKKAVYTLLATTQPSQLSPPLIP
jgi:hypothetical protein